MKINEATLSIRVLITYLKLQNKKIIGHSKEKDYNLFRFNYLQFM